MVSQQTTIFTVGDKTPRVGGNTLTVLINSTPQFVMGDVYSGNGAAQTALKKSKGFAGDLFYNEELGLGYDSGSGCSPRIYGNKTAKYSSG